MTTTAPEVAEDLSPAQQAIAVAVAFALAAEAGSEQRVSAWLAGRISRVDCCYAVAQQILQAIAKATLAGEHFAEIEQNHRVNPKIISSTEHERLTRAMDKITREAQQAQADDLAAAVARAVDEDPEPEDDQETEPAEPEDDQEPEIMMRAKRLARAEVIRAGRTAYAEATADALGDDDQFIWKFQASTGACARCLELSRESFENHEDAPADGAHPGCECVLTSEYREEESNV